MSEPFLVLEKISKSFPGVQALDSVHLEVEQGECHALVGENGAGKSTLMKVLSGAVLPDSGTVKLDGDKILIDSPASARRHGIAMIYQELNLLPELTVAENVFLGREPRNRFGLLDRKEMSRQARVWLERLHQDIDPGALTRRLPLARQQMVEIVKALSLKARVVIMDEPSSILTDRELEELFALITRLKAEQLAVIYISHRLEEIFRACDRVTVLRDGRTVSTRPVQAADHATLVREMVGREIGAVFPARRPSEGEIVLEVRGVSRAPRLRRVSLSVRRGEIVGLAGLVGAGRSELARVIFGADGAQEGVIRFEGSELRGHEPSDAIRRGIGLLTEDRKSLGLLLNMNVRENVSLASLARVCRKGFISRAAEKEGVSALVRDLRVRTPSLEQGIANLSGGNQQKTILARWLFTESRFLIFDEPTRGIDVGAKAEIYQLIADLALAGKSLLVISSELPEILGLCHRVYVMREGEIAGEFNAAEVTQERLLACAMGVSISG